MNTIASLLVRLGINTSEFNRGIDDASSRGSKLSGILKGAFGIAAVGATALAGAIGFAGAAGLKFNNAMELTSARIQAFTKDSAKTAEMLDMIKKRAASTPFAFEEMASATANLLPAAKQSGKGIEELIGLAEILAASNPAQGLEGAAFSLKEALGGDFVSIVERFNLPRQRLKELKEQGVPALEAIRIAMNEMGLDADLVSGLANTASGRWSTFKDTMVGVASTVTKPIFDLVSSSLGNINNWLSANQPLLDTFASTLAGKIQSGFTGIGNVVAKVLPLLSVLSETGNLSVGGWARLQGILSSIFGSTLGSLLTTAVKGFMVLKETVDGIMPAFNLLGIYLRTGELSVGGWARLTGIIGNDLTNAVIIAQETFSSLGNIINLLFTGDFSGSLTAIIAQISTLTGIDVATLLQGFFSLRDTFANLPTVFETTIGTIQTRLNTVVEFVNLVISQVTNTFNQYGPQIIDSTSTTFNSILSTINTVLTAVNSVVNMVLAQILTFWRNNGQDILNTTAEIWLQLNRIIQPALELVQGIVTGVFLYIKEFLEEHGDDIQHILDNAWIVVKNVITTALTVIEGIIKAALAIFKGDWDGVWKAFQDIADKTAPMIKNAIEGLFEAIAGIFGTNLKEIADLWTNNFNMLVTIAEKIKNKMVAAGTALVEGIKSGISGAWGKLTKWVEDRINELPEAVRNALGIGSPSKVMADIFNSGFVGGMIAGIEQGSGALMGAIDSLVSSASSKAQEGAQNVAEGFQKGLESSVGQMEKTFSNLMNSGIGSAMGALGISSPSTVFANMAVESVNGLIVGWEATMPQFIKMTGAHAYELAENILKGFEGLARGALNIFKNIRALEVIPAFKPLEDAKKAFESAQKRVNDLDTKMGDINKKVASMGGFQGGDTAAEIKHNEELTKLLAEQSKLRDEQNIAQQDLTDAAMRQSQAQGNANKQAKSLEAIASEAAARYVQLEKITNEMMLTDPQKALKYFEREKAQIQELAQLERERALASSDAERTALDTQIRLLKAAHDAEDRSVNAQISLEGIHDRWSPKMIVDVITQALKNAGISVDLQMRTGG